LTNSIDLATFKELQDTAGVEFVRELVGTFLEEAPVMLRDLQAALAARDAEKFRRGAHSFKSNSLAFGALTLAAIAREHELGGVDAGKPLAALEAEYGRVAQRLGELRRA
jgi:HPt (histidine-containing phosphotransfer) domain-containing protein